MINKYIKKKLHKYASPWVVLAIDMLLVISAYIVAAFIKYAFTLSSNFYYTIYQIPTVFSVFLIVFLITKSYRGIIRYSNIKDMIRVFIALIIGLVVLLIIDLFLNQSYHNTPYDFKRSTLLIHFLLSANVMIFSRLCFSFLFNRIVHEPVEYVNGVIYGAGEMGIAVNNLLSNEKNIKIKAFIDDNKYKARKRINNLTIIHSKKINNKFIKKQNIKVVYIAINNIPKDKIKDIAEKFLSYGVKPKLIPPFQKWVDGVLETSQIKDIKIEDLLSRQAIKLDTALWASNLTNKVVLVTGGAGSIGSEIVRQLSNFKLQKIIVLDQSESSLYDLQQELKRNGCVNSICIVASVCDAIALDLVFKTHKPNLIFHAAAYKHVPLMERFPKEAIKTNVGGAKIVSDLAIKYESERFVMVSTDKAVNPTNVMGATKRAAEIYIGSLSKTRTKTKFMTTRFGNVLGSNGSVIPLFRKQIEQGGPLTVTHKDIIRYFMTIPEASQLVIEAGITGKGGEIFVFDMGRPIKIYDLALNMIKLSGFKYPDEMDIKFTGLRPGEKLYEELLQTEEDSIKTHHNKIKIAKVNITNHNQNITDIEALVNTVQDDEIQDLIIKLKRLIPEYISKNSPFQKLDNN